MKKKVLFLSYIIVFLCVAILPHKAYAQNPPVDPPFWEGNGGGIGGFGEHVPEPCTKLQSLREKISGNGLLGTIVNLGDYGVGDWIDEFAPYGGYGPGLPPGGGQQGGPPGLPPPPPPPGGGSGPDGGQYGGGGLDGMIIEGLGSVFKGIFGGNKSQKETKMAIEELTKVQMTNLVESECNSILQDLYLRMLEQEKIDEINNSDFNKTDILANIEKIQNARDKIGYLRQYLSDEYRLLYDIKSRHERYEATPGYRREIKDQYADYSIREADKLIISARENQLTTGQTKEYIDVLTGMLGNENLTPGQSQQLEGYISAVHASEMTEVKNILAGQAAFIAQTEVRRQQEEKDRYMFELKGRDINDVEVNSMNNAAESSKRRLLIPPWAGDKQ